MIFLQYDILDVERADDKKLKKIREDLDTTIRNSFSYGGSVSDTRKMIALLQTVEKRLASGLQLTGSANL